MIMLAKKKKKKRKNECKFDSEYKLLRILGKGVTRRSRIKDLGEEDIETENRINHAREM